MADEQTMREEILRRAGALFFARGFSGVTTDELAAELGISKKTLYRHFSSKEQILQEAINLIKTEMSARADAVVDNPDADFLHKLQSLMGMVGSVAGRFSKAFMSDLQRKAPHIWNEMEQFRMKKILTLFDRLMQQGHRQKMIRSDVDPHLFVLMFFTLVQNLINPDVLSRLSFSAGEVFRSVMRVLLDGMLTDEARERLREEGLLKKTADMNIPFGGIS